MRSRFVALLFAAAAPLAAQQTTNTDFSWTSKGSVSDKIINLHNLSGRITVVPSTDGAVRILGTVRGRGRNTDRVTIEVNESSRYITACTMYKDIDMECDESGMHMHSNRGRRDRDWDDDVYMDMEVRVPKGLRVEASNVSGDVRITGMEGVIRAGSVSGDVRVEATKASSLRASSVSGDIDVRVESLTGDGMLSFNSVSGNVTAELPKALDADISMRSVSGSLDSDFPLTLNGRVSRNSINARIGKGGRELEVHTVSGDVRLRMGKQ